MKGLVSVLAIPLVAIGVAACGSSTKNAATPASRAATQTPTATGPTSASQIDGAIQLLLGMDSAALSSGAQFRPVGCQADAPSLSAGLEPQCPSGVTPGTPIDAFLVSQCEGSYVTTRSDLQKSIELTLQHGAPHAVYAVVKGGVVDSETGRADPDVAFTVVLSDGSPTSEAMGTLWMINGQGRLVQYYAHCGQTNAFLTARYFGANPTLVFGPATGTATPASPP